VAIAIDRGREFAENKDEDEVKDKVKDE